MSNWVLGLAMVARHVAIKSMLEKYENPVVCVYARVSAQGEVAEFVRTVKFSSQEDMTMFALEASDLQPFRTK